MTSLKLLFIACLIFDFSLCLVNNIAINPYKLAYWNEINGSYTEIQDIFSYEGNTSHKQNPYCP